MSNKKHALIALTLCFCFNSFTLEAQDTINHTIVKNGIGLGSVLAVVLSWDRNKSILLAILHGIFGWLYVIYFAITR